MTSRGREIYDIKQALVDEAGQLIWYARQDVEGERARLEAEVAKLDAELEDLEARLPALQKARDEARSYLDDLRVGKVEEALDANGQLVEGALADANRAWLDAAKAAGNAENANSSLRLERTLKRDELARLQDLERPETPLLDELIKALQ